MVKAQTYHSFVDTNKVWSVVEGYSLFSFNTFYYKFKGDTIINNLVYNKMLANSDSNMVNPWQYHAALREDSLHKVYIIQFNQPEKLLYNFNLQVGDTFHYSQICNLVVNSIDSVQLINGEFRKRINFYSGLNYHWIEGIGSEDGPLNIAVSYCDIDFNAELNCFTENDTLKYKSTTFNSCYFSNTALREIKNDLIKIIPNPAQNQLQIISNAKIKNGSITIQDINGRKVLNQSIVQSSIIDTSSLKNGYYVLYFYEDDMFEQAIKIMIFK